MLGKLSHILTIRDVHPNRETSPISAAQIFYELVKDYKVRVFFLQDYLPSADKRPDLFSLVE